MKGRLLAMFTCFQRACRFRLLVFAALALIAPSPAIASFERDLQMALRDEQAAGVAWSIADGSRQSSGALGFSNAVTLTPMTTGHKVHVGSIAKTMIALGLLQLVSERRLTLDTPVQQILPEMAFQNPWAGKRPILVRHLLDHTSGLEDARIWQVFSARSTPDMPLAAAFSRDPSVLHIRTPPGETFSYSNMGYVLAAMVIERVSGERYEVRLARELLRPLSMSDSTFAFTSQTGPYRDPRLAWGHLGNGALATAIPSALRPAAQFTTTAADMAKLARFLMSDGTVDGRRLIDVRLLRAMGHPQGTLAVRSGLGTGYGLGLVTRDREGTVGYCHQGDTFGYHALLCIYPTEQKAFFLALNRDGDGLDLQRFHRILLRATGPRIHQPKQAIRPAPDLSRWAGHYQPLVSRFAIERYADLLDGGAKVQFAHDRLLLERSGRDPVALVPIGDNLLRADDRVEASHVLIERGRDQILSDGQRSFRKVSPVAGGLLWTNLGLGLAGLAYFLLVIPVMVALGRRNLVQPVLVVLLAFAPAGYLIYRLPFAAWGDLTAGSGLLAVLSAALPLALAGQIWLAMRRRPTLWRGDVIAAGLALQWLAVSGYFGLVPIRLWV